MCVRACMYYNTFSHTYISDLVSISSGLLGGGMGGTPRMNTRVYIIHTHVMYTNIFIFYVVHYYTSILSSVVPITIF